MRYTFREKIQRILLRKDRQDEETIDLVHLEHDTEELLSVFKKEVLRKLPKEKKIGKFDIDGTKEKYNQCLSEVKEIISSLGD